MTSSSGTFSINGNLTAPSGLAVTGGTIAGVGKLAGSLNYTAGGANSTFGGVIAGAGSTLAKNNAASTLTLTGANTYTGPTNVNAAAPCRSAMEPPAPFRAPAE